MTILNEIAEYTKERIEKEKKAIPEEEVRGLAEKLAVMEVDINNLEKDGKAFLFEESIRKEKEMSFICECKKASPSKGLIAEQFPYIDIAKEYEAAGATAISVLTEPKWFLGSDRYLEEIAETVSIPCLRKDFTVDPYMIYQAKIYGAGAVLLICSLLDTDTLTEYINIADSLGLSHIVEAHDEKEIESAMKAKARIIGVNNRNLKDFTVDINNSGRLRALVPAETLFVAESGIKTREDVAKLETIGVNAVLVGETLMRAADKKKMLNELKGMQ
ncbi:MAG: indole-3-glycerol phosphate synthase TrpC [Lachnospiraceae bacterium]|nr:indole-3-glycerol phosphate synthase TrpC [Lachnospiraceae bacterium]